MKSNYRVDFRRRRESKTNYRKRLEYLKSGLPRVVIRRTNNQIIAQITKYNQEGDKTLTSSTSNELKSFGWSANTGNIPAAYLTGFLCGYKAQKEGVKEVIPDLGVQKKQYGTRIFASLKGIKESGLKLEAPEKVFPSEERIKGKHIEKIANKNDSNFSEKKKESKSITESFKEVKNKIEEKLGE